MITNVAAAVLYVGDQDEALAFYRDTLGFELVTDADMGEGAHLTFTADDVAATVAELRSRGATVSDPVSEPWGTYATVDAPDGHRLQFHERRGR
jgi:lactoylglutathione lyase